MYFSDNFDPYLVVWGRNYVSEKYKLTRILKFVTVDNFRANFKIRVTVPPKGEPLRRGEYSNYVVIILYGFNI